MRLYRSGIEFIGGQVPFSTNKDPYVDITTIVLLVILNSILIGLLLYWLYKKSLFKKLYIKSRNSRVSKAPARFIRKLRRKLTGRAKSKRSRSSRDSTRSRDSKRSRGSESSRKSRSKSRSKSKSKSKTSLRSLKVRTPLPKFLANPDIITALKRVEGPVHQQAHPPSHPPAHLSHPLIHQPGIKPVEGPIQFISAFKPIPTDMKTAVPMSENFSDFKLQTATATATAMQPGQPVQPMGETPRAEASAAHFSANFPQQSASPNQAAPTSNTMPTMSAAIPPISGSVPNPSTKSFTESHMPQDAHHDAYHEPRPNEQKAIHPSMISEQVKVMETINLTSQNVEPGKTKDGKEG